MTLAERIKAARDHAKLTQPQLAEKAGISQQSISKLERGIQHETGAIVRIAVTCGVRPEWLDSESGPMFYYDRPLVAQAIQCMEALPDPIVKGFIEQSQRFQEAIGDRDTPLPALEDNAEGQPEALPHTGTATTPVKKILVEDRRKINSPFSHPEWRKKQHG